MTPRGHSPGDLVLVAFPFTNLSGAKVRPAVILAFAATPDVVVAFVTSNIGPLSPFDVVLESSDPEFAVTGLRNASRVRADRLATIETALLQRQIGRAGPNTMTAVRTALRRVFNL